MYISTGLAPSRSQKAFSRWRWRCFLCLCRSRFERKADRERKPRRPRHGFTLRSQSPPGYPHTRNSSICYSRLSQMNKMSTSSRWSGSSGSRPHRKGRGSPGVCPYVGHTFFPPTRGAAYAPGDFHNGTMSSMFHAVTVTHYLMISLPGGGEAVDSSCLESTSTTSTLCLAVTLRKGLGHCSRWLAGSGLEPPGVSRFQVPRERALEQEEGASQEPTEVVC